MEMNSVKRQIKWNDGYSEQTAYPKQVVEDKDVRVCIDLSNHRDSKCWVLMTGDCVFLQSYNTIVSKIDLKTKTLYEGKFTRTTSRQQSWFRDEFNFVITTRKEFEA